MAKTVIYGGTFNPIHNGHVSLMQHLLQSGEYDRLLLFPAASPPHKDAPALASAADRLTMCRLATANMAQVEVDDWEVRQGGKSYTARTIAYLEEKYPHDRFYLLLGADMFLTFCQWREWETIGHKTTLLVASRGSDELHQLGQQQRHLLLSGIGSQIIENPVVQLSSTKIRTQLVQNGVADGLDPVVEQYCKEHKLYGQTYDLRQLRSDIKPLLKADRYCHSLAVEQQAVYLAGRYDVDCNRAAAAGILHDICKNMPDSVLLQMLQSCDTMINVDFKTCPQLLHSYAGAVYIQKTLGVADEDLLNAVRYHTTARRDMSRLEQVVFVADLTSEDRDYPDVEQVRILADRSLEQAMLYVLKYTTRDPCKRGQDTMEALEQYQRYEQEKKFEK